MNNVRLAIIITLLGLAGAEGSLFLGNPLELTITIVIITSITTIILLFVKPYYEEDMEKTNHPDVKHPRLFFTKFAKSKLPVKESVNP